MYENAKLVRLLLVLVSRQKGAFGLNGERSCAPRLEDMIKTRQLEKQQREMIGLHIYVHT